MSWNMDDPKWTAYVLGALDDDEQAELERVLEDNADARAFVASLRETVGTIERELRAQPAQALDELQRKRIQQAATIALPAARGRNRRRWAVGVSVSAAAGVALVMFARRSDRGDEHVADRAVSNNSADTEKLEKELAQLDEKVRVTGQYHMSPSDAGLALALPAGKGEGGKPDKPNEPTATTWKRSQIVPNSSRVMVGDREQLALRSMQTRVAIDGFRARVVIDYVYANEHDRQLEGTFQLRLPEEASPYFFAFGETQYEAKSATRPTLVIASNDAVEPHAIMKSREREWLQPKEARMVPRETAAIAYATTVRGRVDPALVEWAGAGVFTARVFPLAPHKLHRIVIGYDVDLTPIGGDLEYRLDLPDHVPASVVDVSVGGGYPATVSPQVTPQQTGARKVFHFENRKAIAIRLVKPGAPLIAGADAKTGTAFFATRVTPQLPVAAASGTDTAVFLVDTSLSSNPDRFNIYLKLLRAVLDGNRDSLKRFNVLFFSVDAHWYKAGFVENTPQNVDSLIAFGSDLALEGATDLGAALAESVRPAWMQSPGKHDLFLLSDGASTWGEGNLHALGRILDGAGALFAYQTGLAGTDASTLVHLARGTGGAVFTVTGESEIARAATAHRARPWRLESVEVTGASDVLVAGNPTAMFPGQTITIAGRGQLGANAELVLVVEQNGKRETVRTKLATPLASALASRAYGQIATAHLEELELATEPQARAYATHFRVTGRTTSLLMLETEEDYRRFNIKPDDDAYVVKASPAGELFAKALKQTIHTLGDPKAAFLAMLASLEKSPNVKLEIPASYRTAIEQMPASAFRVASSPLATKLRGRAQLGSLAQSLATHVLDYDAITAAARRKQSPPDALKTLSSLVEENPGDAVMARDVGFSAMELGLHSQAYHLFRRVAEARPYEPQTYRAIAQALAAMGKHELALAFFEIPLMGTWDTRFGELKAIVQIDYLRFLRKQQTVNDYAKSRLATLARDVGIDRADIVVTITWNTDNTDVDLHVREPSDEECFYSHPTTRSGGRITRDVTQGYGPEMYVLPRAPKGTYDIRAHYFASDANRASARTKVQVTVIEDWGTAQERATDRVITLETGQENHKLASLSR